MGMHFRAMFATPRSLGMWERWLWIPLVGKGPETESPACGVCCVGWGVRGLSPWGPPGSRARAIPPREHRLFAHGGNPGSRIIQWIFLPDVYPSDDNHYSPDLPPPFVGLNKLGALHISCQPTGSPSCWSSEQQLKYKPIYLRE